MEHLLQKSKCSIFKNIFKYMIFQEVKMRYCGVKQILMLLIMILLELSKKESSILTNIKKHLAWIFLLYSIHATFTAKKMGRTLDILAIP